MAEKLYKYGDSWVSYGYLHDTFGYTTESSFEITYNSVNPWGEMDTTGFLSGSLTDGIHSLLLFKNGMTGWYSLNEMAVNGYYPDGATDATMRNGNVTSNAVYITDLNGTEYYLIQAAISEGWLTLDEWALLGWEPYTVTQIPLGGSMGADYSESVLGEVSERIERCGIAFTGLLRENVIPESGRMERGGIGFTGLLRENFIPESGVVIPYVAKYSYIVLDEDTGKPKYLNTDTGIGYADVELVSLQDDPLVIIEEDPSELTAYFTSNGADNMDTDVGRNSFYYLYDENGQEISGDTSKTYTITGVYKVDGTKLETSSSDFIQVSTLGKLMWYSNVLPSTGRWYYAHKLIYTEL